MLETVLSAAVCTLTRSEALSKGKSKPQELMAGKHCYLPGNNRFLTVTERD